MAAKKTTRKTTPLVKERVDSVRIFDVDFTDKEGNFSHTDSYSYNGTIGKTEVQVQGDSVLVKAECGDAWDLSLKALLALTDAIQKGE